MGTIDAYYDANIDLCSVEPRSSTCTTTDWPTYTLWHNDPPAKTVFEEEDRRSEVHDSLLCPGAIVSGASVRRSILSNRVVVEERAEVEGSIVFGNVTIGKGARVRKAIIDKWVRVPEDFQIGYDRAEDEKRFKVTPSGITVVPAHYEF